DVNDNYNPIGLAFNHGCKIVSGRDRYGDPIDYRGTVGAITDAGADLMMYLTFAKLFKVATGPKNSFQLLEEQAAKNEALSQGAKPKATPPNSTKEFAVKSAKPTQLIRTETIGGNKAART